LRDEFYAHSLDGKQPEDWHKLEDHLKTVAEMARDFELISFIKFLVISEKGGELAI
jgi:hypothetical protein